MQNNPLPALLQAVPAKARRALYVLLLVIAIAGIVYEAFTGLNPRAVRGVHCTVRSRRACGGEHGPLGYPQSPVQHSKPTTSEGADGQAPGNSRNTPSN